MRRSIMKSTESNDANFKEARRAYSKSPPKNNKRINH